MNAATRRLEVSASNVANVFTTGALPATNGTVATGAPQAYQPLRLNETASANGGTQTSVTAAAPSYVAISDPQAPFANQDGLVAAPNVDISQETINQMIASYSFKLQRDTGVSYNTKSRVAADKIVGRTSNVDITARSYELTFKNGKHILKGREANELYAREVMAGVLSNGAAGTIFESVSKLNCTLDRKALKDKAGAGARVCPSA